MTDNMGAGGQKKSLSVQTLTRILQVRVADGLFRELMAPANQVRKLNRQ